MMWVFNNCIFLALTDFPHLSGHITGLSRVRPLIRRAEQQKLIPNDCGEEFVLIPIKYLVGQAGEVQGQQQRHRVATNMQTWATAKSGVYFFPNRQTLLMRVKLLGLVGAAVIFISPLCFDDYIVTEKFLFPLSFRHGFWYFRHDFSKIYCKKAKKDSRAVTGIFFYKNNYLIDKCCFTNFSAFFLNLVKFSHIRFSFYYFFFAEPLRRLSANALEKLCKIRRIRETQAVGNFFTNQFGES
jgi:hypothetical protein